MTETPGFVIVGGGLAGAKAAEALRDKGYDGPLTLIGDETALPYERPPLSKDYLAGKASQPDFTVHDQAWYQEHDIDLRLGQQVTGVDAPQHEVELADGTKIPYAKLLLATGSRARTLSLPGADADHVISLRRIDDSDRIKLLRKEGKRIVLIGGGWIGMEIAANTREAGADVTIIEAADLPLGSALGPELAQVFLDMHREQGVVFHLGATVAKITTHDGSATGVLLADGTTVPADAVVVGVGAAPNVELAQRAGLAVENGVLVGESLRSSDPDIYAAGDIANHQHPVLQQRIRVEHWANALNQPAAAAASMLGDPTPYEELPYFFTDQYDLGMEYVGYAPPGSYARVVTRGDLAKREFIAFWMDADNRVLAGMNVNVWDVVDDIKSLILSGEPVDVDRLADSDVPLPDLR